MWILATEYQKFVAEDLIRLMWAEDKLYEIIKSSGLDFAEWGSSVYCMSLCLSLSDPITHF